MLFNTGNYAESIAEYQAAIAINDKLWDLHYSLGAVYKMQGEYDKAIQEMLTGVALNPTNPDILTEISRTYATEGQYGKAIQYRRTGPQPRPFQRPPARQPGGDAVPE